MIIQHVSEDAALRHPRHEVRSTIALSSILTNQQKVTDDSGQEKYLSSSLESVRDLFYANDGINQQKAGRVPLIFVTSFFQYSHHFRGGRSLLASEIPTVMVPQLRARSDTSSQQQTTASPASGTRRPTTQR